MTTLTVRNKEALNSNEKVPVDDRYWAYQQSTIFRRIAPPALMGDYLDSWDTFVKEMQDSKKCDTILQQLIQVKNLCSYFRIPPSVFFYRMDEEIKESVRFFVGREEWSKMKKIFSKNFFKTLSAGMIARVQYWKNGN